MEKVLVKKQNHITSYYYHVDIQNHSSSIDFSDDFLIKNLSDEVSSYFEAIYNHEFFLVSIIQYINFKKVIEYQFSRKGNLISLTHFSHEETGKHIKIIYDYSYSVKQIKEKRFYTSSHRYLKKEIYDKEEHLKSIYYYKEGNPYYVENFDRKGFLLESVYYNENGLLVK